MVTRLKKVKGWETVMLRTVSRFTLRVEDCKNPQTKDESVGKDPLKHITAAISLQLMWRTRRGNHVWSHHSRGIVWDTRRLQGEQVWEEWITCWKTVKAKGDQEDYSNKLVWAALEEEKQERLTEYEGEI